MARSTDRYRRERDWSLSYRRLLGTLSVMLHHIAAGTPTQGKTIQPRKLRSGSGFLTCLGGTARGREVRRVAAGGIPREILSGPSSDGLTLTDAVVSVLLRIFETLLNNGCFGQPGTCIVSRLPVRNTTLLTNRLQVWRSRLCCWGGLCGDLNRRRSKLSCCSASQPFTRNRERRTCEANEDNCAAEQ